MLLSSNLTGPSSAQDRCDIIHVHEWGGAFVDLVTAVHLRQLKPGLRVAVIPHGGHVWYADSPLHHFLLPLVSRPVTSTDTQ